MGRSLNKTGTGLPSTFSCERSIEIIAAVKEMKRIDIMGHNEVLLGFGRGRSLSRSKDTDFILTWPSAKKM